MARFVNPLNGYEQTDGGRYAWLWCLLFGPVYFLARGNYALGLMSLILAGATAGFSWLIFPFFVDLINREDLLRKGFKEIDDEEDDKTSHPNDE